MFLSSRRRRQQTLEPRRNRLAKNWEIRVREPVYEDPDLNRYRLPRDCKYMILHQSTFAGRIVIKGFAEMKARQSKDWVVRSFQDFSLSQSVTVREPPRKFSRKDYALSPYVERGDRCNHQSSSLNSSDLEFWSD